MRSESEISSDLHSLQKYILGIPTQDHSKLRHFVRTKRNEDKRHSTDYRKILFIRPEHSNGQIQGPVRIIEASDDRLSSARSTRQSSLFPSSDTSSTFRDRMSSRTLDVSSSKISASESRRIVHITPENNDEVYPNGSVTILTSTQTPPEERILQKLNSLGRSSMNSPIKVYITNSRSERHLLQYGSAKSFIIHRKSKICIYEGKKYKIGDTVPTSEPCLECLCYERTIICGLRVCPKTSYLKDMLKGCQVTQTKGKCCPDIKCSARGKNLLVSILPIIVITNKYSFSFEQIFYPAKIFAPIINFGNIIFDFQCI